jgi:hypothetical protein
MSDQEIFDILYPHMLDVDGGYSMDYFSSKVIAGVRDVIAAYELAKDIRCAAAWSCAAMA